VMKESVSMLFTVLQDAIREPDGESIRQTKPRKLTYGGNPFSG